MFIIWGWRGIPETIDSGHFHCPSCRRRTEYDHQQMRTYVTIFFIPVLPLAAGERFVACRRCQMAYLEEVLLLPTPEEEESRRYSPGEPILGKRGEYWYPGKISSKSGKKIWVDFADGKHDVLTKSQVIPLDLREGDPIFVRVLDSSDYRFGTITAIKDETYDVRFEDGTQESANLARLRAIWEDDDAS